MRQRFVCAAIIVTLFALLAGCSPAPHDAAPADPPVVVGPGGEDQAPGDAPPPPDGTGAPPPVDPLPTPVPSETGGADPGDETFADPVAEYQARCARGVDEWRAGQVDYPSDMTVAIESAASYNAAIDVRTQPLPAEQVIETEPGSAASEPVLVKCTVAARLTAVGSSLVVAERSDASDAGWAVQEFTPAGVVEWSWTVTALDPVDQQLLLELRPAIVVDAGAGDLEYAGRSISSFTTDVRVDASPLHHAAYWVDVNRPLIWTIGGAVGAAVLAVVMWWRKLRPRPRSSVEVKPDVARPGDAGPGRGQLRPE